MAIFGKKKTLKERMDELLAEVDGLSEEEQKKFWDEFESKSPDEKEEPTTDEQIEKAEEDIEEKGPDSQTEKDRIDESVGEQEKEDGDEDSQSAKDRVDESEGEEKYVKREEFDKLMERIEALENKGKEELPKPHEEEDSDDWGKDTDFFKE